MDQPQTRLTVFLIPQFYNMGKNCDCSVRNVAIFANSESVKDVIFDEKAINGVIYFNAVKSWCRVWFLERKFMFLEQL